ncbi:MAG: hypothetical protein QM662_16210, partial [Gordonia sp. (in: high G+C Gram-positive bacteria)]
GVRELRLIGAHQPAYNRRSRHPHRGWWITFSGERFPRLVVSRTPDDHAVGPVSGRTEAIEIAEVISRVARLRTCRARLPAAATHHWCPTPAAGGQLVGACAAAADRPQTRTDYAAHVQAATELFEGRGDALIDALIGELDRLVAAEMFETAARHRDRVSATIECLTRAHRLAALCRLAELVVARPDGRGGWELAVIRHGRLASAGVARRGVAPMPVVDALIATAETVLPGPGPLAGAPAEEAGLLYRWITGPGTRIVATSDGFALPARSAAGRADWASTARAARQAAGR